MTAVAGALYIDCGVGFEDKQTGRIRYSRPPRARYECLLCRTTEGPVTGALPVREFVRDIRTDHRARCSATTAATQQGALAA